MAEKVSDDDLQMRNRWPIRERFIKSWDTERKKTEFEPLMKDDTCLL